MSDQPFMKYNWDCILIHEWHHQLDTLTMFHCKERYVVVPPPVTIFSLFHLGQRCEKIIPIEHAASWLKEIGEDLPPDIPPAIAENHPQFFKQGMESELWKRRQGIHRRFAGESALITDEPTDEECRKLLLLVSAKYGHAKMNGLPGESDGLPRKREVIEKCRVLRLIETDAIHGKNGVEIWIKMTPRGHDWLNGSPEMVADCTAEMTLSTFDQQDSGDQEKQDHGADNSDAGMESVPLMRKTAGGANECYGESDLGIVASPDLKEEEPADGHGARGARPNGHQEVVDDKNAFYRESNDLWFIRVNGKEGRFKFVFGFYYLHQVFSNPERDIWPSELQQAREAGGISEYAHSGSGFDEVGGATDTKGRRPPWVLRGEEREKYYQLKKEVEEIKTGVPKGNSLAEDQEKEIAWRKMELIDLLGDLSREQKAANAIRNRVNEVKKRLQENGFNKLVDHIKTHLPKIGVPITYHPGRELLFTQGQLSNPASRK